MTTPQQARELLRGLIGFALRDLDMAFAELVKLPADRVAAPLAEVLLGIEAKYGDAAATLAADWYDDMRDKANADGRYMARTSDAPTPRRFESLAQWGTRPLFGETPNVAAALSLISGGLQRTLADRHRLTIVENSIADPAASGWKRVGVGGSCGFCRMLIDRGHVYTESSVTFRSHDHCNCAASPEFASNVVKVSTEAYQQSQRHRSDATKAADNARARTYIAERYGDS